MGQNGVDWDLYFDGPAPDCLADLDGWLDGVLTSEVRGD